VVEACLPLAQGPRFDPSPVEKKKKKEKKRKEIFSKS
jgi:hypothetical protein